MKKLIRARVELPGGEDIAYLKEGKFGYRVVHPAKNEDGTINLINLLVGGWENFFKLIFVLFTIFLFLYGVSNLLEGCNDMAQNPCQYTDLDCSGQDAFAFDSEIEFNLGGEDNGQREGS